jgi:hypothetical protein
LPDKANQWSQFAGQTSHLLFFRLPVERPARTPREGELTSDNHDRLVASTTLVEAGTEKAMRRTSWAQAGRCAPRIPTQAAVQIPALAILAIATVLTAAPARAQTYDPNYPVCLQIYDVDGGYIDCGYTSLAQCAQSASGRAAECIVNPYFANPQVSASPRHQQRRRSY